MTHLVVPVDFLITTLWIINDYGFRPKPIKPLCVSAKGLGPLSIEGWGQILLRRILALTQRKTSKNLPVTVIGFILVLFGFRWFLICSLQVYWSQEKPSKTKIKPCQPLALLTPATIKSCNCDRFYLCFIRFSLIPICSLQVYWSQEKPSKTNIKPCHYF